MDFDDKITIRRRHLPHWEMQGACYFITFNICEGEFNKSERKIVKEHIISGNNKYYCYYCGVVMPDHVHLILKLNETYILERVMKGIKGVSANLINKSRNTKGQVWQDEYFDRIIRDEKEFYEKCNYIYENPYRKNLAKDNEIYDGWFINNEMSI